MELVSKDTLLINIIKVILKMINLMDLAEWFIKVEIIIKVNFQMVKWMDVEHIIGLMDHFFKVNGWMEKLMGLDIGNKVQKIVIISLNNMRMVINL